MSTRVQAIAMLFLVALPLAACRSGERHSSVGAGAGKEYRSCCAKECDESCKMACCKAHFADKSSTNEYCPKCGKVCGDECPMECCKN